MFSWPKIMGGRLLSLSCYPTLRANLEYHENEKNKIEKNFSLTEIYSMYVYLNVEHKTGRFYRLQVNKV